MRNFNRGNNKFGGGRDFKRQDFGRRDSSDRFSMHKATCSKCGMECEVPFKPTGVKPVFCSKCFGNNRNSDPRRFEERNSGGKYNNYFGNKNDNRYGNTEEQYKKQFETLNWKLDKILKILTPTVSPEIVQEKKVEKEVKNFKPKKSANSTKKKKTTLGK